MPLDHTGLETQKVSFLDIATAPQGMPDGDVGYVRAGIWGQNLSSPQPLDSAALREGSGLPHPLPAQTFPARNPKQSQQLLSPILIGIQKRSLKFPQSPSPGLCQISYQR